MPRLPVDGKKAIEHRITLGTYEREQLNRFVDGLQVRNIGTGIGAATDPLEAFMSNGIFGTTGGAFFVAWALKRYFGIDVPIPTDSEDLLEIWAAINDAIFLTPEERQELDKKLQAEKTEVKQKAGMFGVKVINLARRFKLTVADVLFGNKDSIQNAPDLYDIDFDQFADVPIDPGLDQSPDDFRKAVAARWYEGTYPFSYARDLLIQSGLSSVAASEYLNQYEREMSGSL